MSPARTRPDFRVGLRGAALSGVRRRGKMLLVDLSGDASGDLPGAAEATEPETAQDMHLAVHLKMTGRLWVPPCGDPALATPDKHTHIVFHLSGGCVMHFKDVRKFALVSGHDRPGTGRDGISAFPGTGASGNVCRRVCRGLQGEGRGDQGRAAQSEGPCGHRQYLCGRVAFPGGNRAACQGLGRIAQTAGGAVPPCAGKSCFRPLRKTVRPFPTTEPPAAMPEPFRTASMSMAGPGNHVSAVGPSWPCARSPGAPVPIAPVARSNFSYRSAEKGAITVLPSNTGQWSGSGYVSRPHVFLNSQPLPQHRESFCKLFNPSVWLAHLHGRSPPFPGRSFQVIQRKEKYHACRTFLL